jgi:EAL and modified HD-GYP domain-containing signal transduction protein
MNVPIDLQHTFLARQPILDRDQNLVAYELLFRSGGGPTADVSDDLQASASVIIHAFGEMGVREVLGDRRGFVNISADLLLSDMVELLPKEQVVLELLETIAVTDEIVERCRALKKEGFALALDDFFRLDETLRPLLDLVEVVKIDLTLVEPSALEGMVHQLQAWPVKLLAEKVDRPEQAQRCLALGFDLFQGYYFAMPAVLSGKRVDPSTLALLHLLGLVLGDAETVEIEQAFKHDPTLTYNLLRLVNSVGSGVTQKINSLKHAIVVLGRRQLQRWLQLLLFTLHHRASSQYPSPLMQLAATRGRLLELLAGHEPGRDPDYQDRAFMAGLMSLLDALLEMSLADIITHLNLSDEVRLALLERGGPLGRLLRLAERSEQGDFEGTAELLRQCPWLDPNALTTAQLEAMAWAEEIGIPAR